MLAAMCLTASTELGPNQWIANIVEFSANVHGLLVLAWISGIMAVGRYCAGPIVHRLSASGVLLASAIFAAIGLVLLSRSTSAFAAFASAGVFAVGVCYFWPTMVGFVAERLPKTGALGLSTIGGVGMLAVNFVQPWMGSIYDGRINETIEAQVETIAIPADALAQVELVTEPTEQIQARVAAARDVISKSDKGTPANQTWRDVQSEGGREALWRVAALPVVLVLIFGGIYAMDRKKGHGHSSAEASSE
jgi:hypothetical protein